MKAITIIVGIIMFLLLAGDAHAAYAVNITNVSETSQSTAAGTNATYVFNMTNNGTSGTDSYTLTIANLNSASVAGINISTLLILNQNATQYFELNVTNTASGTFYVNVTAISVNDTTKYYYVNTTTTVTAVRAVNFSNITATSGASTKAGTNYTYTLIITNNGTDPDSYSITIANFSYASVASTNLTSIYLTAGSNKYITFNMTNTTANVSGLAFKVNLTATSVNDSTKYGWVNTSTSIYDMPSITTYSPATPVTDSWGIISRTFSITVNQSATVTYYLNGTSVGSATGTTVTYTNSTPRPGTWNITASAVTSAGVVSQTWIWNVPSSTLSSLTVVTNLSSSDRVKTGSNSSLNFSWTDTGNITTINVTFPGKAFGFYNVITDNVTSRIGNCAINKATSEIGCYNATGADNTVMFINFTVNVTSSSTSGIYSINIKTNKNTTGVNVSLYARDATKPFYIKSNNTVLTVGTETFGTLTTTVPLTGTGMANLTFWIPYIGGQTNITAGWGATNASIVRSSSTLNTSYVETNPSVANPIITLSSEFESGNLPAVITATAISGLVIVYAYLRRRRRH